MSLTAKPFTPDYAEQWDTFCQEAVNATFLHSHRFLSYHGDRFEDLSLLIYDDDRLCALLPAARAPDDPTCVISHPGATYGGFVHDGRLSGERVIDAFRAVRPIFNESGCNRFLYKAMPHIYAKTPADDDLYALFRIGATRVRCDLSSAIDLTSRRTLSSRRKRSLKKARRSVAISADMSELGAFWDVLEGNLARKHDAHPVHSRTEIEDLAARFPEEILIRTARSEDRVVAGALLFVSRRVWHAQYIAANDEGYALSALDAVFDTAIADAGLAGTRYFDFGSSNEDGGRVLNKGLYQFKTEFGGGGVALEFFLVNLDDL